MFEIDQISLNHGSEWLLGARLFEKQNMMHIGMPLQMKKLVVESRTFHVLLSKPKLRIGRQNPCVHLQLLLSGGLVQENCRSQRIQQGLSTKMIKHE